MMNARATLHKLANVSRRTKLIAGIITATLLLSISGITYGQQNRDNAIARNQENDARSTTGGTKRLDHKDAKDQDRVSSDKPKPGTPPDSDKKAEPGKPSPAAPKPAPAAAAPKYSTSSDPRSTAYSTRPVTNPANVDIRINQPNQVPVGTLIGYSAAKGDRSYYGGDLIASAVPTIVKSSGVFQAPVSIRTPDGSTANIPAKPWYIPYNGVSIAYNTPLAAGSQWDMVVNVDRNLPAGTYTAHVEALRGSSSESDSWAYHGFVVVRVVD